MRTRRRGEWRRPVGALYGPAPPRRVADLRATFVNHATVLVQMNGVNVLTDPVWSERVSPFSWVGPKRWRPPGVRFEDLPQIDLVLLSHNHYDHLDLATLERLFRRGRPWIATGLGNQALLSGNGIASATDLDWWESASGGGRVTVTCVPVQHFSGRGLSDRNRTLWCAFVVSGPSGDVYYAGDTGYGPHFRMIRERFPRLRLAILPIGAYQPEWFMGPVHLSPSDALRAHGELAAGTSLGVHYGTFELADDGQDEAPKEISRLLARLAEPRPRFWTLEFGEGRDVPPRQDVGGRT